MKNPHAQTLYYGCPMWGHKAWQGRLYPANTRNKLQHYAQHFNSVEGNTTFYATPSTDTLKHWREQVDDTFKFCFKFPQSITHRAQLRHCNDETREFLQKMSLLDGNLGPIQIQLSAKFSPHNLRHLSVFLSQLPDEFDYAVEVRHPEFFNKSDAEKQLNQLLMQHQVDRVCFDSRGLFASTDTDSDTLHAQSKKPNLPVHAIATGKHPIIRFIGPLDNAKALAYTAVWQKKIQQWQQDGIQPYLFFHTPNNHQAPELCKAFMHEFTA